MAIKFEKREWFNRQSQFPSRRRLTEVPGIENVYEIDRAEGDIAETGNAFDADNMNDLEDRTHSAFSNLDDTDISITDPSNVFTANRLDGALTELFTYADNGKKAIATAIGANASSSDTFAVLGSKIVTLKNTSNSEITDGKKAIATAIGKTKSGTPSETESFTQLANRIKNDKKSFFIGSGTIVAGGSLPVAYTHIQHFSFNFGFVPKEVFLYSIWYMTGSQHNLGCATRDVGMGDGSSSHGMGYGITNVTANGFDFFLQTGGRSGVKLESTNVTIVALE